MKRLICLVLAGLFSTLVAAATLTSTLTWNAVTANTDGTTPLSITYNVYEGPTASTLGATAVATNISTLTDALTTGAAPGAQACFAVTAVNDQGVESAQSAAACKSFPKSIPNAPTGLVVK